MTASPSTTPVVFLMGPTASGKTGLAVELADMLPLRLISVDSALVYRGLDIGTAKPDAATLSRTPHQLIDIVEPEEIYSAGRFRTDALAAIEAAHAEDRTPLLVGGTMMYFRALAQGIGPMPPADPNIRADLVRETGDRGLAALYAELGKNDPQATARIHPHDPQRIQRALEVWRLTGRPISQWQQYSEPLPNPVLRLALAPADRERLHARIAQRFRTMIEAGLVEEVEALRKRPGIHADLPAMRAVGYRQVWAYLEGRLSREEMIERGIIATRQLAKRQLTWLRREADVEWLDSETVTAARVAARIRQFIDACNAG